MKFIPILILSLLLSGCPLFKKHDEPVISPAKPVQVDAEALIGCSLLKTNLVIGSFEEGLVAYADLAEAYGVCAKKQNTSIKIIKQFGSIK